MASGRVKSEGSRGAWESILPATTSVVDPVLESSSAEPPSAAEASAPVPEATLSASSPSDEEMAKMSTSRLLEEKKNLHAYLKAFEKNFQKSNQRPVTKQEDIAPVAEEYRRYKKTLKTLLAQRKAESSTSDSKA